MLCQGDKVIWMASSRWEREPKHIGIVVEVIRNEAGLENTLYRVKFGQELRLVFATQLRPARHASSDAA